MLHQLIMHKCYTHRIFNPCLWLAYEAFISILLVFIIHCNHNFWSALVCVLVQN